VKVALIVPPVVGLIYIPDKRLSASFFEGKLFVFFAILFHLLVASYKLLKCLSIFVAPMRLALHDPNSVLKPLQLHYRSQKTGPAVAEQPLLSITSFVYVIPQVRFIKIPS